jgi:hypothetical protein
MGKNQSASNLTNIIKQDSDGSIAFMHGNTMLMQVSSSGTIETTGNVAGTASYAANAELFDGLDSTIFATTGSNTFTRVQYISSSINAVNFTDTASLYTDGGMRVTKDVYLSSSLFIKGDLTIFGTQSVNYITSSQLDISDNIITVNTSTPSVRFGGIAVKDSGSLGTGLTGSLLWDSQRDLWLYNNPSGSTYDSAMVMMGPQNVGALGSEVGITTNAIPKGVGNHHMTSSGIFESGSNMGIGTASPAFKLDVQGTGRFTGALTGTSAAFSNNISISNGSISNDSGDRSLTIYGSLGSSDSDVAALQLIQMWNGRAYRSIVSAQQDIAGGPASSALVFKTSAFNGTDVVTSEKMRITNTGNVGIGTNTPSFGKLSIVGTDNTTVSSTLWGTSAGAGLVASVYNASQTTNSVAGIRLITRDSGASVWNIYNISRGGDNGDLAFGNGAGGAGTEKMRILNNGDIGIGTSNPASKLHISGSGANTQTLNLQSSANNANAYAVFTSGNKSYVTGLSGDISNSYIIYDNNAAVTRLSIASGGAATFSGNLAINNTLSSPGNLIETAALNLYLRPASGYKVFIDTGDGLDVTSGITNLSNLRVSTLFTEYTKNLSGAYSAGTFYPIVASNQMASGVYILKAYIDTYAIGGGTYFITYVSVPFFFYTGGTNNSGAQTFPTMLGSGHAGYNPPIIRLRLSAGVEGGLTYLEFDPNANWSNVTGGGGATVTFFVKRLGD